MKITATVGSQKRINRKAKNAAQLVERMQKNNADYAAKNRKKK